MKSCNNRDFKVTEVLSTKTMCMAMSSNEFLHFDYNHSSFPVVHNVGNVDIFVLLKFENKLDTVVG